jgi:hypothetical protein
MGNASLFRKGDIVQLNELSKKSAKLGSRRGVIIGPSRLKGKFRVLWSSLKRPQIVEARLLKLVQREPVARLEVEIATIEDELEMIRQVRFARHLNMPRPPPHQVYEVEPGVWSKLRVLDYIFAGVVGLAAATITIFQ